MKSYYNVIIKFIYLIKNVLVVDRQKSEEKKLMEERERNRKMGILPPVVSILIFISNFSSAKCISKEFFFFQLSNDTFRFCLSGRVCETV